MCKLFKSYEESLHLGVCKLAKYVRNCIVFWKNLHSWQQFYTTAGRDKFQVCTYPTPSLAVQYLAILLGKNALYNFICGIGLNGKQIKRCELDLKHVSATFEAVVAALLKCVIFVKFSYPLFPRSFCIEHFLWNFHCLNFAWENICIWNARNAEMRTNGSSWELDDVFSSETRLNLYL